MTTDDGPDTRDELIEQLRQLAAEIGCSPTMADLRNTSGYPSVHRFLDEFGTWNKAKEAADLETFRKEGRGETYSREELIKCLQQLARKTDGMVTKEDVDDTDSCPSAVTFQRHFGSWNAAKEAAGLETIAMEETPEKYTDEELCDLLRSLAAEVEGPLTIQDVEEADDYPDHTTFERRFGSWNAAKEAAGLEPVEKGQGERGPTYSDDELLQFLRDLASEIDGPLTAAALEDAEEYPSLSTYKRRFGSWTAAKAEAGLDEQPEKA